MVVTVFSLTETKAKKDQEGPKSHRLIRYQICTFQINKLNLK